MVVFFIIVFPLILFVFQLFQYQTSNKNWTEMIFLYVTIMCEVYVVVVALFFFFVFYEQVILWLLNFCMEELFVHVHIATKICF